MKADDLGMVVLFDSDWFEKAISLYFFEFRALRTNLMMFERIHFLGRNPIEYAM